MVVIMCHISFLCIQRTPKIGFHYGLWLDDFGCLLLYVPVNSYGHVGAVSSPNHFFLGQA